MVRRWRWGLERLLLVLVLQLQLELHVLPVLQERHRIRRGRAPDAVVGGVAIGEAEGVVRGHTTMGYHAGRR